MRKHPVKRLLVVLGVTAALGIGSAAAAHGAPQPQQVGSAAVDMGQSAPVRAQGAFDGLWTMTQSNPVTVQMFLSAPDPAGTFTGFASFGGGTGNIRGQLTGNDVQFDIAWSFGRTGRYFGHLGSNGEWSGTCFDLSNPSSHATWFARR